MGVPYVEVGWLAGFRSSKPMPSEALAEWFGLGFWAFEKRSGGLRFFFFGVEGCFYLHHSESRCSHSQEVAICKGPW